MEHVCAARRLCMLIETEPRLRKPLLHFDSDGQWQFSSLDDRLDRTGTLWLVRLNFIIHGVITASPQAFPFLNCGFDFSFSLPLAPLLSRGDYQKRILHRTSGSLGRHP